MPGCWEQVFVQVVTLRFFFLLFFSVWQMYKGFDKVQHVQHIYTEASESLCGIKFEINKYQYLITGKLTHTPQHTLYCMWLIRSP